MVGALGMIAATMVRRALAALAIALAFGGVAQAACEGSENAAGAAR
jgi:hypothetical protein